VQTTYTSTNTHPAATGARWERLTLASGAVAASMFLAGAILFIGFVAPSMPAMDAKPAEQVAFYALQAGNPIYRLVSFLGEAQMPFLLLFFSGLLGVLRRAERGEGVLSTAVFAAGIAIAVIAPFAIMIEDHLLLGMATSPIDPWVVRSFDGIGPVAFGLSGYPQAVVLLGTAALLGRQLPRWITWLGLATAAICVVACGTPVVGQLFPFAALSTLLFRVWLLALSISLVRRVGAA
jgi:hypothetical protein